MALKVLRAPAPTAEERGRLLREARVLAGLEHPGIVPVHDVGTLADGRPFDVMKRVRGERLDAWARRGGADGGAPARAERLRVFRHVCDAVAFAHAAGVVHRDLKPQNVMLGPFGEVLVLDWGVAKVRGDAAGAAPPGDALGTGAPLAGDTAAGTVLGTPGYMAPEQAVGAAADARRRLPWCSATCSCASRCWRSADGEGPSAFGGTHHVRGVSISSICPAPIQHSSRRGGGES